MEEFWKAALKVSGPVAVVGVILWALVHFLYQQEILSLFNSEQRFTITLTVSCGLIVALIAAVIKQKPEPVDQAPNKNKAVFTKSTIHGDVVLGDKHESKK